MRSKILILLSLVLFSLPVFAQELVFAEVKKVEEPSATLIAPRKIENEINNAIIQIYGEEKAPEIYDKVMQIAKSAIENRPEDLRKEDLTRSEDWYKDEIIYMFYVDQFGVVTPEKPNQFKDTAEMFDYLSDLGVTTLYLLPFADSPMSDAGFDVKNPQNIRKDLGGTPQFKEFIKEAKANGFKIKSDLVLNHFSQVIYK